MTPAPTRREEAERLFRAVAYRIPFADGPLVGALYRYNDTHHRTHLGDAAGRLGDSLTRAGLWLNRNRLTRKRP